MTCELGSCICNMFEFGIMIIRLITLLIIRVYTCAHYAYAFIDQLKKKNSPYNSIFTLDVSLIFFIQTH